MVPAHVVEKLLFPVERQARSIARSAVEAEDMSQEAWVKFLEAWPRLRRLKPAALLSWMQSALLDVRDERRLARLREQPDPDELEWAGIL